jgi:hypothetical protein
MMTEKEIHDICKKYYIRNYSINPDGSINVRGDVSLSSTGLSELPLKFGIVSGSFYCYLNQLTSLEGSPNYVGGSFECFNNKLTSLEGLSKIIKGSLFCMNNKLTNLKGIETVDKFIFCETNPLESLEGYNGNYDKLNCDNRTHLIKKHKRKQKLKILEEFHL